MIRSINRRTGWMAVTRRGAGEAADVAVGSVPVVSTALDAHVLLTGRNVITGERVGPGGRVVAFAGVVTPVSGGQIRGLWKITRAGTGRIFEGPFGKIYEHTTSGLFWSKDVTGHGGSVWKVFTEEATGLRWLSDADEYGDFIVTKHKSRVGEFIPFSNLNGVDR